MKEVNMNKETYQYFHYHEVPQSLIKLLSNRSAQSPYRQKFHIESEFGYLNDPNGFSYFNGKYHLFYQWSPLKYAEENIWYQGWHHLISNDLVNWQSLGPGIEPDSIYESHGVYSGSSLDLGEELLVFYTGNTRDENWKRKPYQIIAKMDKNNQIKKELPPAIQGQPKGYTDHFRDPKLWIKDGKFYAIVGVQRENKTGAALVLVSDNVSDWQIVGEIETGLDSFGYMWECPDYFEIEDVAILVFSPQGIAHEGEKYQNIYQTGYIVGRPISQEKLNFNETAQFVELDRGFDFYAPQSSQLPDGRRVLFGWMGLPEINYPTEKYGYCGCLSVPREITYRNDRICQYPVDELTALRDELMVVDNNNICSISMQSDIELLIEKANISNWKLMIGFDTHFKENLIIRFDQLKNQLYLDRSMLKQSIAPEYGTQRCIYENLDEIVSLRILLDTSSIEIFINQGVSSASARFFTDSKQRFIQFDSQLQKLSGKIWSMRGE